MYCLLFLLSKQEYIESKEGKRDFWNKAMDVVRNEMKEQHKNDFERTVTRRVDQGFLSFIEPYQVELTFTAVRAKIKARFRVRG